MKRFGLLLVVFMFSSCASLPPMTTVDYVDLSRFMGDWYVIANIPSFFEKDTYNSVESYELNDDGTVATTFTYRHKGFDGEKKTHTPKGFILDKKTNARWGMQFIWPIKADYRVIYLDEGYSQTIIGRQRRDYVWIMSRQPDISEQDYEKLVKVIEQQGYDTSKVQRVPQQWPEGV